MPLEGKEDAWRRQSREPWGDCKCFPAFLLGSSTRFLIENSLKNPNLSSGASAVEQAGAGLEAERLAAWERSPSRRSELQILPFTAEQGLTRQQILVISFFIKKTPTVGRGELPAWRGRGAG